MRTPTVAALTGVLLLASCGSHEAPTSDERAQLDEALQTMTFQCVLISSGNGGDKAKIKDAVDYVVKEADEAGDASFRQDGKTVTVPKLVGQVAKGFDRTKCDPEQAKRLRDASD